MKQGIRGALLRACETGLACKPGRGRRSGLGTRRTDEPYWEYGESFAGVSQSLALRRWNGKGLQAFALPAGVQRSAGASSAGIVRLVRLNTL